MKFDNIKSLEKYVNKPQLLRTLSNKKLQELADFIDSNISEYRQVSTPWSDEDIIAFEILADAWKVAKTIFKVRGVKLGAWRYK